MIHGAFSHLPGIGPGREQLLREAGVDTWQDLLRQPRTLLGLSPAAWERLRHAVEQCEQALADDDLLFLVRQLHPRDQWRILAEKLDAASFFDIETSGMECDSSITVIACLHRGEVHVFSAEEDMTPFLEMLDEVRMLVSFNGASFDVPRVLRHYNVPELPCPHLDLRWLCHHAGFCGGGLKRIEQALGIVRPPQLQGVDGAAAVALWHLWERTGNRRALEQLKTYCAADVVSLKYVAAHVVGSMHPEARDRIPAPDWRELQAARPTRTTAGAARAAAALEIDNRRERTAARLRAQLRRQGRAD